MSRTKDDQKIETTGESVPQRSPVSSDADRLDILSGAVSKAMEVAEPALKGREIGYDGEGKELYGRILNTSERIGLVSKAMDLLKEAQAIIK